MRRFCLSYVFEDFLDAGFPIRFGQVGRHPDHGTKLKMLLDFEERKEHVILLNICGY
jgi:hypothetical protein